MSDGSDDGAALATLSIMTDRIALALDLGGTKVEAALVSADGGIISGTRFREPTGPSRSSEGLAASVDSVVHQALNVAPTGTEIVGVGVGAAGPIQVRDGAVSPLNLPVWRGYPLKAQLEQAVPEVPVTIRMDGLCITLAEHWIGAAQGSDNVMGMIVSTGVGGGLILGGQTVAGPSGNAGHIGHIEIAGFDDPCACGGRGCLEAVASGPRTVRWAREQGFSGETGEDLAAAYAAGNEVAVAAVRRSGLAIGHAIASATSLVDLEIVAIGGGFSHVTPDLFDFIREPIAERVEFDYIRAVKVVPSGLSGDGPLIGAAALIHRAELVPAA
jgi:glucokinase